MLSNSSFWLFYITLIILAIVFVLFLLALVWIHKSKQNFYHLNKAKMIQHHRLKLLEIKFTEKEKSMEILSWEIHDNILQLLSLTRQNLFRIKKYATQENQKEIIEETGVLVDTLSKDLRNVSYTLNGTYLKNTGLISALEKEIKMRQHTSSLHCVFETEGTYKTMHPDKELMILRIVQLAAHNACKHSKGSHLQVLFHNGEEHITISIEDDGKGFTTDKPLMVAGVGILSMYQRAKVLGGLLTIQSAPTKGTLVQLIVPREKEEN